MKLNIFFFLIFVSQTTFTQWTQDMLIPNDTVYSGNPNAVVSGSNIHIAYEDGRHGDTEIYYKRSTNDGVSWDKETRLTIDPNYSYRPIIAVSGSVLHLIWRDGRSGQGTNVYYRRSTDNGVNWSSELRISNGPAAGNTPHIAAFNSFVFAVWEDSRDGNIEVYFRRSTNGGLNWETEGRLTNDAASSRNPVVSISGQDIHVV